MPIQVLNSTLDAIPAMALAIDANDIIITAFGRDWRHVYPNWHSLAGSAFDTLNKSPFRRRHIQACRAGGQNITVITPYNNRQYECTYSPINNSNTATGAVMCFAHDKTIEMEQDYQIIQSSFEIAATTRARVLEEMAMAVAHEINNPLTVISGHTSALEMLATKGKFTRELGEQHFVAVSRNIRRISTIVRCLIELSADADYEAPVDHNLMALAQRAVDAVKLRVNCSDITFRLLSDGNQFLPLRDGQIVGAIEQLLLNAVLAVRELKEKWIEIKYEASADELILSITDSGSGIPGDLRHKIMTPFFTTRDVGEGSGIGLNLAKRDFLLNGGTLSLDHGAKHTRFLIKFQKPGSERVN